MSANTLILQHDGQEYVGREAAIETPRLLMDADGTFNVELRVRGDHWQGWVGWTAVEAANCGIHIAAILRIAGVNGWWQLRWAKDVIALFDPTDDSQPVGLMHWTDPTCVVLFDRHTPPGESAPEGQRDERD